MNNRIILMLMFTVGLFVACASNKNNNADKQSLQIEDVKWQLVELNGEKVNERVNGRTPYLELQSSENRYAANGGCNGIGGTYEISGNSAIKFSQGFSTKMACPEMEVEMELLNLFPIVDAFSLDTGHLLLKNSQGSVIARFKKMD